MGLNPLEFQLKELKGIRRWGPHFVNALGPWGPHFVNALGPWGPHFVNAQGPWGPHFVKAFLLMDWIWAYHSFVKSFHNRYFIVYQSGWRRNTAIRVGSLRVKSRDRICCLWLLLFVYSAARIILESHQCSWEKAGCNPKQDYSDQELDKSSSVLKIVSLAHPETGFSCILSKLGQWLVQIVFALEPMCFLYHRLFECHVFVRRSICSEKWGCIADPKHECTVWPFTTNLGTRDRFTSNACPMVILVVAMVSPNHWPKPLPKLLTDPHFLTRSEVNGVSRYLEPNWLRKVIFKVDSE